ncbi:MAG: Choline-sulfatase [Opitutia bacterium UBA7350]|nr:MAG: Choline-sulfatase [Opitutae bacterium UBA7350]
MFKKVLLPLCVSILFIWFSTLHGAQVINFTAEDITNFVSLNSDTNFSESSETLNSSTSSGYTGHPIHAGFEEEGAAAWSANIYSGSGLRLRWNSGQGATGEICSGLYLFKKADFQALSSGSIQMDANNDTINGIFGGLSANGATSAATIRIVIKDDLGYHISNPQNIISNIAFSYEARDLTYSSFTPTINDPNVGAGTIGSVSNPTFQGITWIGFRLDAVRGSNPAQGVNIGVKEFNAQAITLVNSSSQSNEVLEMRSVVDTFTPSTFADVSTTYSLSGTDAASFSISTNGELTFNSPPVYSAQASYSVVVEMTDGNNIENETVTINILEGAALTNRTRFHATGNYNVLFIPIDDLRPLLNHYGEDDPLRPITPNFDRLAASSVTFLNAYCQQAICNASRASVLTGLRPDTTKCWNLGTHFRTTLPNVVTLPQQFGTQNYTVHGVGKVYHGLSDKKQDNSPSDWGIVSWEDGWQNPGTGLDTYYEDGTNSSVWGTFDKAASEDAGHGTCSATDVGEFKRSGGAIADNDYKDGMAAQLGVAKISTYAAEYQNNGTPFFLAVGFQKPHLPFNCPKTYWDMYDPNDIDLSGYDGTRVMPAGTNRFTAPFGGEPFDYGINGTPELTGTWGSTGLTSSDHNEPAPTQAELRHLIHGYLACVSFIDTQLGKLLDALEDPDGNPATSDSIVDNTIVVIWGDHGFHLGDHGGFMAKHNNFEISTRVPLIIRAPDLVNLGTAGTQCNAPVELIDIYPTLLDLCSLPVSTTSSHDLEGTSFLPLLEDPYQPWKEGAYSQYQRFISANKSGDTALSAAGSGWGIGYSIRTDRYRYTEWWRTTASNYPIFNGSESSSQLNIHEVDTGVSEPSFIELYDYANDPEETVNLAVISGGTDYSALMAELSALLNDDNATYSGDGWAQAASDAPATYPITQANWRAQHAAPGRSTSDLLDGQDPDKDGIKNELEYAFGTNPFVRDLSPVTGSVSAGQLKISYPVVNERNDIALVAKTSTILDPNSFSTIGVSVSNSTTQGNKTIMEAVIDTTESKGFLIVEPQ